MAHLVQMLRHSKYVDLSTILNKLEADSLLPNYIVHGYDGATTCGGNQITASRYPDFNVDDTADTYVQRIIDTDKPPSAFQARIGQIFMDH